MTPSSRLSIYCPLIGAIPLCRTAGGQSVVAEVSGRFRSVTWPNTEEDSCLYRIDNQLLCCHGQSLVAFFRRPHGQVTSPRRSDPEPLGVPATANFSLQLVEFCACPLMLSIVAAVVSGAACGKASDHFGPAERRSLQNVEASAEEHRPRCPLAFGTRAVVSS